jgi:dipeptidyl aminopeptidase/acylaminoacyl peptidase
MVNLIPTEFISEDETVRGNLVTPDGDGPFPGICKFHGLPGSADQISGAATRLAEAGFAVLTFDFRGFRKSDGLFSLAGEIKDAHAAITYLLESDLTVDSWAGVYGASYGGAVATCAAADDTRIKAICLRAPVYDTLWFAQSPLIGPEVDRLAATDPTQIRGIDDPEIQAEILRRMVEDARVHNPMTEISKISPRPLLIIHGTRDVGIDMAGVKRLYEKAGEPKDLVIVAGADHELTDPRTYEITMNAAVEWFKKQWIKHSRS